MCTSTRRSKLECEKYRKLIKFFSLQKVHENKCRISCCFCWTLKSQRRKKKKQDKLGTQNEKTAMPAPPTLFLSTFRTKCALHRIQTTTSYNMHFLTSVTVAWLLTGKANAVYQYTHIQCLAFLNVMKIKCQLLKTT